MKGHSIFENKKVMIITAVCCCIAWSSALPSLKISFSMLNITGDFEKILFGGLRYMLAGMGVLVFARLKQKKRVALKRKDVPFTLLIAFLQTFGAMILCYIGISNTTGVKCSILIPTSVFMVALLAHFMFKNDKLNGRKVIGLLLGFAGVLVVNVSLLGGEEASFRFMGEGFILISVAMGALTMVLIRKYGGRFDTVLLNGRQLLLAGAGMCVVGFIGHPHLPVFNIATGALFIHLAAVTAVCFTLWFVMLGHHNASLLEQYKFIVPISGSLLSVLLLPGEHIGIEILIAVLLVSVGTIIVNRQDSIATL